MEDLMWEVLRSGGDSGGTGVGHVGGEECGVEIPRRGVKSSCL
jgi:hypothetical protein